MNMFFHLIIDGVLHHSVDEEVGRRILSELPALIGMKVLAGPYVVEGVVFRYLEKHLPFKKMNTRMLERSEE